MTPGETGKALLTMEYRQANTGNRINIFAWLAYQPYKWLVVALILGLSTLLLGIAAMSLAALKFRAAADRIAVFWARLNSFFTPMTVRVSGRSNIDPACSYVIVANHQSLYDIFVLYGWLGVDFRWVMKKELEKVPIIGPACKMLGHIFIDRSDREKAIASLQEAREEIKGGTSVIFFPEGSRSADGKLRPFKKGAFKMAIDMDIPLLPITLKGTRDVLPKGTMDLWPGAAEMIIHPPIAVTGYTDDNLKELMETARKQILSGQP